MIFPKFNGIDLMQYANYLDTGLTTIYKPVDEIIRIGVDYLKRIMNSKGKLIDKDELIQVVPTQLVIRDTVSDLRK